VVTKQHIVPSYGTDCYYDMGASGQVKVDVKRPVETTATENGYEIWHVKCEEHV
jgi:hypothetical protein